eukprot:767694-Hanusia_phi.AAC.1
MSEEKKGGGEGSGETESAKDSSINQLHLQAGKQIHTTINGSKVQNCNKGKRALATLSNVPLLVLCFKFDPILSHPPPPLLPLLLRAHESAPLQLPPPPRRRAPGRQPLPHPPRVPSRPTSPRGRPCPPPVPQSPPPWVSCASMRSRASSRSSRMRGEEAEEREAGAGDRSSTHVGISILPSSVIRNLVGSL